MGGAGAYDDQGRLVSPSDAYAQTVFIFRKIEKALRQADASLEDVVRTRMFVTGMSCQHDIGRVHAEFFRDIRPVATMVGIPALVEPGMLVEIEVDAYVEAEKG